MKNFGRILILCFIFYKLALIFLMWSGRNVPPEPDDSYSYINEIKKIAISRQLFPDFVASPRGSSNYNRYIPFTLGISLVSWLTKVNVDFLYFCNFIFGTIILALVINIFLNSYTKDKNLYLLCYIFLILYNGNGAYHGFYWVVPTFYSFLIFLSIWVLIYNQKTNYPLLLILVLLFILIHPISFYALSIFIFYFLIILIFEKKPDKHFFIKIGFVIISGLLIYFLTNILFQKINNNSTFTSGSPDSLRATITYQSLQLPQVKQEPKIEIFNKVGIYQSSINNFNKEYLRILFPNIIILFGFLFYFIRVAKKYKKITYLYLACLLFSLGSLMHPIGQRSLLFLWPVTFILIAHFFLLLYYDLINFKPLFYLALFLISIYASYNNIHWILYMRNLDNFNWDKSCANLLLDSVKEDEIISYDSKLSQLAFHSVGLYKKRTLSFSTYIHYLHSNQIPRVDYFVISSKNKLEDYFLNTQGQIIPFKDCGYFKIYHIQNEK